MRENVYLFDGNWCAVLGYLILPCTATYACQKILPNSKNSRGMPPHYQKSSQAPYSSDELRELSERNIILKATINAIVNKNGRVKHHDVYVNTRFAALTALMAGKVFARPGGLPISTHSIRMKS